MADVRLSVIIPAHDKEDELPVTLAGLHAGLTAAGVPYEIIVVDNASTDATARVAEAGNARLVYEPYRQISRARNTGSAHTSGEWLLFVDTDTWPSRALLESALRYLGEGVCGGGALADSGGGVFRFCTTRCVRGDWWFRYTVLCGGRGDSIAAPAAVGAGARALVRDHRRSAGGDVGTQGCVVFARAASPDGVDGGAVPAGDAESAVDVVLVSAAGENARIRE